MINSVSAQTIEFLFSALLGLYLGVLFDVIRTVRTYMPKKRWITAIFDALFWLVAVISLLGFVMTVSGGKMRWYVLAGAFSGGFVYMAALSEIVYKVLVCVIAAMKKVLHLITKPVYLLLGCIWRGAKKTEHKAEARLRERVKIRRMKKRKAVCDGSKKKKKKSGSVS